jgi:hypothetical protein
MQDYEAETWACKYRIDLSTVEASRKLYSTPFLMIRRNLELHTVILYSNDMVVLNERELLILFNEDRVLRCDIDGNFLGIVKLGKGQYRLWLTQHRLQESIVPIPNHEVQEEESK